MMAKEYNTIRATIEILICDWYAEDEQSDESAMLSALEEGAYLIEGYSIDEVILEEEEEDDDD